jgi:hypothetical protein
MEGFSFVTPITGLNGPNSGKEDDDDDGDDDDVVYHSRCNVGVKRFKRLSYVSNANRRTILYCIKTYCH